MTWPMSASPRFIAISAKPKILKPCSANFPPTTTRGWRCYANDLPHSGRPVRAKTRESKAADHRFMELALMLGRRGQGRTWPNPAVGAVVVKDGVIVGRGWTQPGGRPHAESEALTRAGEATVGATLYVTLEPCSHVGKTPACADTAIACGITRVVSAIEDPNPEVAGQGHARLRSAGIT